MVYPTLHDFLIDQCRNPIEKALNKGDKEKVMEILDFFIWKYEESNALSKGFEEYALERGLKFKMPILEFMEKYVNKYMPKNPKRK